ncbi:MAG: ABA4-like family protein [Jannaschia sp.]
MTPDLLFRIGSILALSGWAILALTPLAPRAVLFVSGIVLPLTLCALYAIAAALWLPTAPGGFDSLANVQLLFTDPGAATAGWIHFLAFDLLVGAWIVRDARAASLPHIAVLPCLFATLMLGPVGLLSWLGLRTLLTRKATLA